MKKLSYRVAGGLVTIVAAVWLIGSQLPVEHLATTSAEYEHPPEVVWSVISDISELPTWRSAVDTIDRLPDRNGRVSWRETGAYGSMSLELEETLPPLRMVTRITDPDLPYGGRWIYELEPLPSGSRLTITENGEIYNPAFRFMSRFVFGYTETMDRYLDDLAARLEDEVSAQTFRTAR
jgi:uncharacterized protein YndB with AHSA1/START domain